MVDVGQINSDGTFDISNVEEDQQLLVRTDQNGVVRTRWIFRNEAGDLIIHERSENPGDVSHIGSFLSIGAAGYATVSMSSNYDNGTCAKLLCDVNWNDLSQFLNKSVTIDGEEYVAALVPVKLL